MNRSSKTILILVFGKNWFHADRVLNPRRMNRFNSIVAAMIFFLTTLAVSLTAGNLLTNPSFESDPAGQTQNLVGWTWYGQTWGNTYNETGSTAHTGSNYFKVFQGFTGAVNYNGIYQDYISGPGATYSAAGWAYTSSSDVLAGQNVAWIEVTFRDAGENILALYRSSQITTNAIQIKQFPTNTWINLPVTNQCNPLTTAVTNAVRTLVAPAGTCFARYQIVLQGEAGNANGSVYFDDLSLNLTSTSAYGDYNLVWSDEFNGTAVNTNVWTYDLGNSGWGNQELEYYTSRTNNALVAGSLLHIIAQKEAYNGASYTSARLKSQGLFSRLYGRIEWRAKLPAGGGFWPALWLLGTNISTIGWPGCGEMDVMEANGGYPGTVQGSLHSGSDETGFYYFPTGDSVTNFHTYTLDWGTNAFLFYVDGHVFERQTNWSSAVGGAYPFPFNQPFFFIMNLAVGGSYLGNPSPATINTNTVFPGEMQVDYVRIYNGTAPLRLSLAGSNNNWLVSWPSNIVAHLQSQTNLAAGWGTNWMDLPPGTNFLRINPTNKSAFYRLVSP